MGLDTNGIRFLLYAKKNNIEFGKTLTLGRQSYQLHPQELRAILKENGFSEVDISGLTTDYTYAEPLLKRLGALEVQSIDASDYESATRIHDMNNPIPESLIQQFDTVLDAGTLEHIFNFPNAIKNCMEMIKPGGHFLGITCANNFSGHGFYQFSPELFFRVFSEDNGFETIKMFLVINEPGKYWYEITDPKKIRKRIIFENSKQSYLYIIARRTSISPIFAVTPQQSDYEHLAWTGENGSIIHKKSLSQKIFFFLSDRTKKKIRRNLRILDPQAWKIFLRDAGNARKNELRKVRNS